MISKGWVVFVTVILLEEEIEHVLESWQQCFEYLIWDILWSWGFTSSKFSSFLFYTSLDKFANIL
jgi:hypothetical protein